MPALPVLVVAGLMAGGAHGFLYPGLAALVADQAPEARRGAVIGVFSAVFLVGNAGGAFLFGYVAHALGYGRMWACSPGCCSPAPASAWACGRGAARAGGP